ncbi:MAG: ABC transporter permease [Bacteroidales bacterium]|nr:ABC transporter permease [Bacteroidales bacterium]
MSWEFFTAKKIIFQRVNETRISRPIINIAVVGIALGMAVMILSVAIVTGFKDTIRQKVVGFGSHIEISNYDANNSFENIPIPKNQSFYPGIEKSPEITHIQIFATKAGIIKTDEDFQGIVLKGIDKDYDWHFIKENLAAGDVIRINDFEKNNGILISKKIADLLHLKLGDKMVIYFIEDPPRIRKFFIKGIYNTGLEEFDKLFAFVDIKHIQKLNNWTKNQVGGFEITIDDFDHLDDAYKQVFLAAGNSFLPNGGRLKVQTILDKYPYIFDWIALFNTNVYVIIILLLMVAGINMSSGILILILERTTLIGTLKALGATNGSVARIFLQVGSIMVGKGLLYGNVLGIILCLVQQYFQLFKLDPESYYVSYVPIHLNFIHILLLNVGSLIFTSLVLILPTLIIARIKPSKAIKFN